MIIPALLQYIYGYRYNPSVVDEFKDNVTIIKKNLTNEKLLVYDHYDFYKILEKTSDLKIVNSISQKENIAVLGKIEGDAKDNYQISRIITSPKRDNSDIIYLYTYTEKEGE